MIVGALLPSPGCGRVLALFLCARIVGWFFVVGSFVLFGLLPVPIFIGEVLSVLFSFLFLAVWAVAPPCFLGEVLSVFSIPLGLGLVYSLVVSFFPLVINSYLSKKKKKKPPIQFTYVRLKRKGPK